jgi:hypothetical protein
MQISILFPILFLFISFILASSDISAIPSSEIFTFKDRDGLDLVIRNLYRHFLNKDDSVTCAAYALNVRLNLGTHQFNQVDNDPGFIGAMTSIVRSYMNEKLFEMSKPDLSKIRTLATEYIQKTPLDSEQMLYYWFVYIHEDCEKIEPNFRKSVKGVILLSNAKKALNLAKNRGFNSAWLEKATTLLHQAQDDYLDSIKRIFLSTNYEGKINK